MSRLSTVTLPDFGMAKARPVIPAALYRERMAALRERMRRESVDLILVYGDREHFANLQYLTGFDPRFEEALLLVDAKASARLLLGNECMGYQPDASLGIDVELFQDFSLLGQPRGGCRPLTEILRSSGVVEGVRVGCVGWKYFEGDAVPGGSTAIEVPAYLVDLLRELVGDRALVTNATRMLMGPSDGLRVRNEPEQIAFFEYAATVASEGVRAALQNLAVGVREDELERHMDSRGLPLSCHRMVGFGEKAKRGLASASDNTSGPGDAFTTAFGVTGALTSRAGFIASSPDDLPGEARDFYPRFIANYYDVVVAWYETIRVGVTAGAVVDAVARVRDDSLLSFALNPGHYIHLDEWVHSPFSPGVDISLGTGVAIQLDIIPVSRGPFVCSNAEDGIVLADEALRDELQARYPEMSARVQARRAFMREELGIELDESVLPLSNIPGWVPPYALDPGRAMVSDRR